MLHNSGALGSFGNNAVMFSEDSPVVPFEKLKEEAIRHSLKITEGNIVEAARKLKIGSRNSLSVNG